MGAEVDITSPPSRASTTGEPFLRIRLKDKVIGRCLLNKPRMTLGRSPRSDIVLDNTAGVSREHAHILIIDGEVLIEDLNSRNGTFVNGQICARRTLQHGDRISIGGYRLRYRCALRGERKSPPPPSAQQKTADLLRKWNDAAVVERPDACPLCRHEIVVDGAAAISCAGVFECIDESQATGQSELTPEADSADTDHAADPARAGNATVAANSAEMGAAAGPASAADPANPPNTVSTADPANAVDAADAADEMTPVATSDPQFKAPPARAHEGDKPRQGAPEAGRDAVIPSGVASAGDTTEGMYPELFLVPSSGGTGYRRRLRCADTGSQRPQATVAPGPDRSSPAAAADDTGETRSPRRFRRKLVPRKLRRPS